MSKHEMWKVYRQWGPHNNDINSHGFRTAKIKKLIIFCNSIYAYINSDTYNTEKLSYKIDLLVQ
jgi:hypothetical protein